MFTHRSIILCALLASGCVTTGNYKKAVTNLEKLRADDRLAAQGREKELEAQIKGMEQKRTELEKQIGKITAERDTLRQKLDESSALVGELTQRLIKLGQNVEKLTQDKGQLAQVLEEAKTRLAEMRKQTAAAEARAATFRTLMERLKSMIDSGQLKVVVREGHMVIALPNDVLFDSGKINIKTDGQAALVNVAHVLAGIADRHFLVAGYTDTMPIRTERFPSNWELSTARAVVVTKFLITNGMKPQVLGAAGYGEYDPVAPNDTTEHRALNRRIEIILQPNLADLPSLNNLIGSAKP